MYNFHSHTHFCDGSNPPEDYILAAIQSGFKVYGFSGHIPLRRGQSTWNMTMSHFLEYIREVKRLKEKYKDKITVFCGLEGDYYYGFGLRNELRLQFPEIDYVVGSIHYLHPPEDHDQWEIDGTKEEFIRGLHHYYNGDIRQSVEAYFRLSCEMIEVENPEILGHADKIKIHGLVDENASWYRNAWKELLRVVKENETILEVNTRGLYTGRWNDFYPSKEIIKEAAELKIPLQLSSDAHQPPEIRLNFDFASNYLRSLDVQTVRVYSENEVWCDVEIPKESIG